MSLLFNKLAKYVAKISLVVIVALLLFSNVDAQKRAKGKAKPKPSAKAKNFKKPTGKSKARPKVVPRPKILPKILPVAIPFHRELHYTEESWADAVAFKFVVVVSPLNVGVITYRVMHDEKEEHFSIKTDGETAYVVPIKEKDGNLDIGGCFMMMYCKVHNTALFFSQIQCF